MPFYSCHPHSRILLFFFMGRSSHRVWNRMIHREMKALVAISSRCESGGWTVIPKLLPLLLPKNQVVVWQVHGSDGFPLTNPLSTNSKPIFLIPTIFEAMAPDGNVPVYNPLFHGTNNFNFRVLFHFNTVIRSSQSHYANLIGIFPWKKPPDLVLH